MVPTGIAGFDDMTGSGLPAGRTTLVTGGLGSGKTTFTLQMLVSGAASGKCGIFVAFEESVASIRANSANFKWDFVSANDRFFWLDARVSSETVISGQFAMHGLLAALSSQLEETGAKRITFDSRDVLLSLLGSADLAVREVRRLHEWLAQRA